MFTLGSFSLLSGRANTLIKSIPAPRLLLLKHVISDQLFCLLVEIKCINRPKLTMMLIVMSIAPYCEIGAGTKV